MRKITLIDRYHVECERSFELKWTRLFKGKLGKEDEVSVAGTR